MSEIHDPFGRSDRPQLGIGNGCTGLCNVDGRLRALYGPDYHLIIESEVGKGTRVRIRIPLKAKLDRLESL